MTRAHIAIRAARIAHRIGPWATYQYLTRHGVPMGMYWAAWDFEQRRTSCA